MATKVYVTDKDEVRELSCVTDGQNFMNEIIGGNDSEGQFSTAREDADFEMCEADFCWWEEWAYREQRIVDTANEIGEEAIAEIARLGTEYNDLDALHDAQERYLGL